MIVYVIGGIIGLVYGSLVAYFNSKLMENYIQKNKNEEDPMQTAKGFTAKRHIINAIAIVILCLLFKLLNQYWFPSILGALIAMTLMSYYFLYRIGKKDQDNKQKE